MTTIRPLFAVLTISSSFLASAQFAPSDSLFNTDQVVEVDLDFGDNDAFWATLVQYYENDQGETLLGDVTITDQTGTWTYYNVAVDLKGNSSYSHPGNKKSFKIDFNDDIAGQKYHGMAKVHFNNCWSDPTFLREKIFFDYCQDHGVLAPRVLYANVTMNGTFWGFYNLVEAVDKDFLDRWIDDDNGNLFKAADNFGMGGGGGGGGSAEADLAYYGSAQASYSSRYELKTNETANDWSDLIALLDLLNNTTDAELIEQIPTRMAWDGVLRSLAMDNLFGNLDTYINSARNYYLYHDSTTFLWNWIKWDANMAFGAYPAQGQNALTLSPTYVANNRPLMERIMGIPTLRTQYLNAYCAVKEDFTNAYLDGRIDALVDLIAPHVAADPNKQYTLAQFNTNITSDITVTGGGPGGSQTLRGLKSFITTRANSLSGLLDCTAASVADGLEEPVLRVYPVPAVDRVEVQLPAGARMADLRLVDGMGREVPIEPSAGGFSVEHLASGIYRLTALTADGPVTANLVRR